MCSSLGAYESPPRDLSSERARPGIAPPPLPAFGAPWIPWQSNRHGLIFERATRVIKKAGRNARWNLQLGLRQKSQRKKGRLLFLAVGVGMAIMRVRMQWGKGARGGAVGTGLEGGKPRCSVGVTARVLDVSDTSSLWSPCMYTPSHTYIDNNASDIHGICKPN